MNDTATATPATEVRPDRLAAGLAYVKHAMGTEPMRPILMGVLFEGTEDGLYLVAADNYRVARAKVDDEDWTAFGRVTVAAEELPLIVAFLKRKPLGVATITNPGSPYLTIAQGGRQIVVRAIDGQYPNYRSIIPTSIDRTIEANPRYLAEAVSAAKAAGFMVATLILRDRFDPIMVGSSDGEFIEIIMPVRTSSEPTAWEPK